MIQNLIERRTITGKRFYEYPIFEEYKNKLSVRTLSRDFDIGNHESLKECAHPVLAELDTAVSCRRGRWCSQLGLRPSPLSFDSQMHGVEICSIKKKKSEDKTPQEYIAEIPHPLEGDIFMTNVVGLPLLIRTADCACVVIYDPILNIFANIHAGWKGIAQKAVAISVSELSKRYGSERKNMIATISPMLGPCCAEFSDPEKELPHFMRPFFLEEGHVDLWAACENQLAGSGVLPGNIFNPRICTFCNPEYFFSYRREKEKAGRFGTIVMLT